MKLLLNSILKCFFYSQYSNKIIDFDKDTIKQFLKKLNKKLFKENFLLFIADMINKLDKSYISIINFNKKYYLRKLNKKIKMPDYIIIDKDEIMIDFITSSVSIEKKFNITYKFDGNDNKKDNELLFNGFKYKLDSYIIDDNNYYITKNDKLSLKHLKKYKLLIYVLDTQKKIITST